ncbi:MAG: hypothetical protein SWZ49_18160 [Cyanobacteriota bacterium]|nr:hypothetical protein [Cyanobacteriota bacterium]
MLSNRILTRREFLATLLLEITSVKSKLNSQIPPRKYQLGERVIIRGTCNDERSSNYGGIVWDSGVILGYC